MSDFEKTVADALRDVKGDFARKEKVGDAPIDPQVREQINADLDGLIDKHDHPKKEFPNWI